MAQFQEYEGSQVITIWNVTGPKLKDNMKSILVPPSEFRDSLVITYPFCTQMFRAYPPGNVRRPFPNAYGVIAVPETSFPFFLMCTCRRIAPVPIRQD